MRKLNKIKFLIPFITVVALLLMATPVMAASPTDVDISWDGAGLVGGSVDTGDAVGYFNSAGATNTGVFTAHDSNNNPYGYGVDSCAFTLDTGISGNGWAELNVQRLTSKESMYGAAGQESYTFVGILDGSATLQNRSSTNYASMKDSNYGWNANDHITVTGSSLGYELQRYVDSGNYNFAGILANGTGDADLDCMSSEASAGQVRLGWGCGCYTNADFNADGTGQMMLSAQGNNSATTAMSPGMTGATSFQFIANWVNGAFGVADYSATAN